MSNLTQEQITEIQKALKESIDLFYNKLDLKYMLSIRDLEQEIDIIRNEISKLRRDLVNRGMI